MKRDWINVVACRLCGCCIDDGHDVVRDGSYMWTEWRRPTQEEQEYYGFGPEKMCRESARFTATDHVKLRQEIAPELCYYCFYKAVKSMSRRLRFQPPTRTEVTEFIIQILKSPPQWASDPENAFMPIGPRTRRGEPSVIKRHRIDPQLSNLERR